MTEKKIIAVVGATGAQGGGLVRAILADPAGPFTARALTRNADSDRARELASQGVEVIEADLDEETSLRKAFDGAYGALWSPTSGRSAPPSRSGPAPAPRWNSIRPPPPPEPPRT